MEDSAYLMEAAAGLFFLVAGLRLLRLAARTRELPERLLGWTFVLMGVSYAFYEATFPFPALERWWVPLNLGGRITYDASALAVGIFTWQAFRREAAWAAWLTLAIALLLSAGIALSGLAGDWAGFSMDNAGFWCEWVGQCVPFVWASAESLGHYRAARRRLRLGLCDPLVCNRYLLWSLFGLMQVCTLIILIPMYAEFESESRFSSLMDSLLGSFEILTVAVIWLVFFPPGSYRSWVRGSQAASEPVGEG